MKRILGLLLLQFALASVSVAQGIQRTTLHGTAYDGHGKAVPGVAVTVTSQALQRARTISTDEEGTYRLAALPAGDYAVTFARSGFATVTVMVAVPVGGVIAQDVVLEPARVQESVVVTATVRESGGSSHIRRNEIEALATPRTLQGIAQLAPELTENSPGTNQLVINGAFAFDNVFMLNGVDVNDNLRAQPQNLFIEDAIQETQVLTSGISAEYGRFTGGVVNAVTRSGGNRPGGSLRLNFFNPAWTSETPYERANGVARLNKLQQTLETTAGGPIVRDRLWFFAAGRRQASDSTDTLPMTGTSYVQTIDNSRGELKLTGSVASAQTLQGGFAVNNTTTRNGSGALPFIIDAHSLDTVSVPNWYSFANYHGVVGGTTLLEAQYTERRFTTGGGNRSTDLVDSPFFSVLGLGPYVWNAPYFDRSDLEGRNNRQLTASLSRSAKWYGRHELKSGYEFFRSQRSGGGSQSSTGMVFFADFATDADGLPLADSDGRLIPVFEPGMTAINQVQAQKGAVLNVDTHSAYITDRWQLGPRFSANLGARFEHAGAVSTGNVVSVDTSSVVPRLGGTYDLHGDGRDSVQATYGVYAGRYNEAQIGANSPVVNATELIRFYTGPAGAGRNFAPGFDLANYPATPDNAFVSYPPPSNVLVAPALKSPRVHEITAGYRTGRGAGQWYAGYIWRKTTNLIEDMQRITDGTTNLVLDGIDAGEVTNRVLENSDVARRDYQALSFESTYRLSSRWHLRGHYTAQLKNHGNYEGETSAMPGATSIIGNYPEAFSEERFFPYGRLQSFQRHRLRVWSIYSFAAGQKADVSVSGLWRVDSGRVFSLTTNVPLTSTQSEILAAAGYPDAPTPNLVFFGGRGAGAFNGSALFDASTTTTLHLGSWHPWIKVDLFNALNNNSLTSWNTNITADPASPVDALGLPTGYVQGRLFGQATSTSQFAQPFNGATGGRTLRIAVGVRF